MDTIGARWLKSAMISIAICGLLSSCGSVSDLLGLNSGPAPAEEAPAGGCMLIGLESAGGTSPSGRCELSIDDAVAQIEQYKPLDGISADGLGQLKEALIAQLRSAGAEKVSSAPPAGERNEIWDVALVGGDADGWQLQWSYTNTGDYDQNGEVGVSDLTPVGVHFGLTDEVDNWLAASLADGDENGEVGVSDITPIGQNFLAQVGGYNAYGASDPQGPWAYVASGELPELPKDMPVRLFLDLPGNDYEFYHVRAYDYGEAEGEPSLLAAESPEPPLVELEDDTYLASLVIGPEGGTIEGPAASPIEGVSVEFPPEALSEGVEVSLGYNTGRIVIDGNEIDTPILALDCGDVYEFNRPVQITFPAACEEDLLPVACYIEPDGDLQGLQLVEANQAAGTCTLEISHASRIFWLAMMYQLSEKIKSRAICTEFFIDPDGFAVKNRRTAFTAGNCFGMCTFAKWYFDEGIITTDGELYSSFRDTVHDEDPYTTDPIAQDVIATRAQISVERFWREYGLAGYGREYVAGDAHNYNALYTMLTITRLPQVLILDQSVDEDLTQVPVGRHAVLAFTIVTDPAKDKTVIAIYDPNNPGIVRPIEYIQSLKKFKPVQVGGTTFDKIVYFGTGTIRYGESFDDLLVDARQNFQGSLNATVDVLSHTSGAHVQDRSIDLYGKIYSGEVLVERTAIINSKFRVEFDVDTNGEFNISVPVFKGENKIYFDPMGFDEDNRLRHLQSNLTVKPLIIEGDFDSTAMLVELSWDYAPQMACGMFLRNMATNEYMCYFTDYQTVSGGGEFWRNPTTDPAGYGPEYAQWEPTDSVFDPLVYPHGQDWGVYVRCLIFNPTLGVSALPYRVILIQDEGTASEKRQVINGSFSETTAVYPLFEVPPWQLAATFHLGAQ